MALLQEIRDARAVLDRPLVFGDERQIYAHRLLERVELLKETLRRAGLDSASIQMVLRNADENELPALEEAFR